MGRRHWTKEAGNGIIDPLLILFRARSSGLHETSVLRRPEVVARPFAFLEPAAMRRGHSVTVVASVFERNVARTAEKGNAI